MAAPFHLSFAVLVLSILSLGIYDVLTNFEQNGCEMTYMFEYPSYQRIHIGEIQKEFPTYGLHIYGEGNLKLSGIPVLFIPGNAGSYKQVRSLGSVALRMAERSQTKAHFNYFVVDFNEELSGLYGGVLYRQTKFVSNCVKKILTFYKGSKHPPSSVILVGHSMGGMIARALFTFPDFDPSLVNTVITQATPHQEPAINLDSHLDSFYKSVNKYWITNADRNVRHVTVVSTGGGYRDKQVRYALTTLTGIVSKDRAISVSTMSAPKSWVSTDHLCAVWCRQMVLLTQRALFDIIDQETMQITSDPELRMKAFQHHFVSNNGMHDYLTHEENKTILLNSDIAFDIKRDVFWKEFQKKVSSSRYVAVPLIVEEGKDSVYIMSNLTNSEWVCYCDIPKGENRCSQCTSLSSRSRLLPPLYSNSKYLQVSHNEINVSNDTHIVIMIPAGSKQVSVMSERYNSNERHLVYHMPNTYDTIISYPISATDGAALMKIRNGSSFYSLHLAGLNLPTNTYTAKISPQFCRRHHAEPHEGTVLQLNVPWSHEDTYTYASYGKDISISIKLQTGRPVDYDWQMDASEPHLRMFLHPYCQYTLRLVVASQDSMGQAARFYAVLLPGYFIAVLLLTLRGVLMVQGKGQGVTTQVFSPADSLFDFAKPYYLIPVTFILRYIIRFGPISRLLSSLGLPSDDASYLQEQGVWFSLLPLLLYTAAWMCSYLHVSFVHQMLSLLSYIGKLFFWLPASLVEKAPVLQIIVSVLAVCLTSLCGMLGMLLISILLIIKILHLLYIIGQKLDSKDTHRKLAIYFPLMLLVQWQCVCSISPLVVWLKNGIYSQSWLSPLTPDPSRLPAIVTCLCMAFFLISEDGEAMTRFHTQFANIFLYGAVLGIMLYAVQSFYRLPVFICCAFLVLTFPRALLNFLFKLGVGRGKEE